VANLLSRLESLLFGAAIGRASSEAVTPVLEPVRQRSWLRNRVRVLDPGSAARLAAQGLVAESEAEAEAARNGYDLNRLGAMIRLAQTTPGVSEAFALRRRGEISEAQLHHVYRKAQIEPQYYGPLDVLLDALLDPAQVAAAIHRGLIPDPGLLKGEQPSGPRKVEQYPVYPIDALETAASHGLDREQLGVMVGLQGLPMGPHEAAQALFRGIITHGDYIAAFNESNNRNEWAQAVLEQSKQIPTARDFFENALRGYHSLAWAQEQAERHGMSHEDSLVIYQNQGRPMNIHAIQQALARGAKFHPEPGEITDPFDAAIVEGNLKPGYYEMAKSLRYTLPSVFTMRALAESGVWSEAKTAERLKWAGWFPPDADEAARAWSAGSRTTKKGLTAADLADEYEGLLVTRAEYVAGLRELGYPADAAEDKARVTDNKLARAARNALIATARSSYIRWRIDQPAVEQALRDADVPAAQASDLLARWVLERELNVHQLTEAQIVAAYKKALFTRDAALERLLDLGFTADDALIRLGSDPRNLSVTDIVKAYVTDVITREDALARLVALGFASADAGIRLDTAKAAGV
jgi:hypothetical protein